MKTLSVITKSEILKDRLSRISCFASVRMFDDFEAFDKTADGLFISDDVMNWSALKDKLDMCKAEQIFYYSSYAVSDLMRTMAKTMGVVLVDSSYGFEQMIEKMKRHMKIQTQNCSKAFVFFGTDAKVGTTMISQCVAQAISDKGMKVGLTHLDGKSGDEFFTGNYHQGLDSIKSKLHTGILSSEELTAVCTKPFSNLYHLRGTEGILKKQTYKPEDITCLLDMMQETFDITIIDAGSDINLGMTIAALLGTPNRFLVTTQQAIGSRRYQKMKKEVLDELFQEPFLVIVNKKTNHPELPSEEEVALSIQGVLTQSLPYLEYGWQCEQEKVPLSSFKNDNFEKGINAIGKLVAHHGNMPWPEKIENLSWFRKKIESMKKIRKEDKRYVGDVQVR